MKPPPFADLFANTWDILTEIATVKNSLRTITFATVDRNGQPQACLVVLRNVDRDNQILEFYMDADSLKYQSLVRNPKAQILVWEEINAIQLRLSVKVTLRQDVKAEEIWQKVPSPSQIAYGKQPPTGSVINGQFDYKNLSSGNKFVVAECRVTSIDYLSLKEVHFRAQFEKRSGWSGKWISP